MNTVKINSFMKAESCEMHLCLRKTMRLSHWAGVFPVEGLNQPDIGKLRFNMKSVYTLYYLSTITSLIIITGFTIHGFLVNELSLTALANLVFYVTGLLSAVFLLKLAREWPSMVRRVFAIERRVTEIHVKKIRPVNYNRITYVILALAAIEHALSIIYKIKNVIVCHNEAVGFNVLEDYFGLTFSYVFKYVTGNYFTFFMCCVANVQATFLWNFTDVMTMCFSMYLTSYFRDLNKIINGQRKQKTHSWEQLRYYYSQLVALVQTVDSKMCYLILISVFSNLFFICLQLYNTLTSGYNLNSVCVGQSQERTKNIDRGINLIYYAYSCLFLVIRAAIMFSLATNVNTVAKEPKFALCYVSSEDYNIHVQRFNRQLRYTTTALSGLFFYVTRGMILKKSSKSLVQADDIAYRALSVFATIITYELVLLQFNYNVII